MQLSDSTFYLYASHYYDNPLCNSLEDFEDDLLRFKYLKKSFYVYKNKGDLRERLIMNHLVVLYNSFETTACTEMLIFKLPEYLDCLFPFLLTMGYIDSERIRKHEIVMDNLVVAKIRDILKEYRNA